MTGDTRFAHLLAMVGDKRCVFFLVTRDARREDVGRFDFWVLLKGMTSATRHCRLAVIALMMD